MNSPSSGAIVTKIRDDKAHTCRECKDDLSFGSRYLCQVCDCNYHLCEKCYKNHSSFATFHPRHQFLLLGFTTAEPIHMHVQCRKCLEKDFLGTRYKCNICTNYNLCERCNVQRTRFHLKHSFEKIRKPEDYSSFYSSDCIHFNVSCSLCESITFVGKKFQCSSCPEIVLCEECYGLRKLLHNENHSFVCFLKEFIKDEKPTLHEVMDTDDEIHENVICNMCKASSFVGKRYKCEDCEENGVFYNLCESCYVYKDNYHAPGHAFLCILSPVHKMDLPTPNIFDLKPTTTEEPNMEENMEKTEGKTSSFDLNCFFTIISFVLDGSILVKILVLSKSVNQYILNHLECTRNVKFVIKESMKTKRYDVSNVNVESNSTKHDYAHNLRVDNFNDLNYPIFMNKFPNLKNLSVNCFSHNNNNFDDSVFENMKNLKRLELNGYFPNVRDGGFKFLVNLEKLAIKFIDSTIIINAFNCNQITDYCFANLKRLEKLFLVNTRKLLQNELPFQELVNLKKLVIHHHNEINGKIFLYCRKLEFLEFYNVRNIDPEYFKYLQYLKVLKIKKCRNIRNIDEIKQFIPYSLRIDFVPTKMKKSKSRNKLNLNSRNRLDQLKIQDETLLSSMSM